MNPVEGQLAFSPHGSQEMSFRGKKTLSKEMISKPKSGAISPQLGAHMRLSQDIPAKMEDDSIHQMDTGVTNRNVSMQLLHKQNASSD